MAIMQTGTSATGITNVDEGFSLRVRDAGGPNPFYISGITGTIGAASNGDVFCMRLDPSAPAPAHITSVSCQFRCIAAFTTPSTFRQLRLRRFSGTVGAGGTAITVAGQNDPSGATSEVNTANGGDARIATTLALTSPGTPDTLEPVDRANLTNFGSIGANASWTWNFSPASGESPLILSPGMSIAIGTAAAWDAGGTWELGVVVKYFEGRRQG